jgi:hypothetical protein
VPPRGGAGSARKTIHEGHVNLNQSFTLERKAENVLKALRRGQSWFTENPGLTSVPSADGSTTTLTPIGQQAAALDAAVADITIHAAEQEAFDRSCRGLAALIAQYRKDLVSDQMVHVATIARVAVPDVVRMTEAFRTPDGVGSEKLLIAADAMAKAGDQYKEEMVRRGLSADFTDELRASAAAYKDAIDTRGAALASRRGAAVAVQGAMQRGREALDTLTVLLKKKLKGNRAKLAEWSQLRRVTQVAVRDDAAATAAPAATGTTTAPTPPNASTPGQGQQSQAA